MHPWWHHGGIAHDRVSGNCRRLQLQEPVLGRNFRTMDSRLHLCVPVRYRLSILHHRAHAKIVGRQRICRRY